MSPLSLQGAEVNASDISGAMADEAKRRYEAAVASGGASSPQTAPKFAAVDLESLSGRFHTVCCLDVMIHYPQVWSGPACKLCCSWGNVLLFWWLRTSRLWVVATVPHC